MVPRQPRATRLPYTTLFRSRMVNGTITTQSLRIDGDQAIERGRYVFGIAPVRGGRPVIRSGEYETVWKYESGRSEEHTSELQSRLHLVCRLPLEKKSDRFPR